MHLQTPQDIMLLEQDLSHQMRSERADLMLLRCRPFVDFRTTVLAHMAAPGSTCLAPGQRVHFWLAGLAICVQEVYPDGSLDACIDQLDILMDI